MTPFIRSMFVVARRDFLAIVATPTFLLFLLAPLFMVAMPAASSSSPIRQISRRFGPPISVSGLE